LARLATSTLFKLSGKPTTAMVILAEAMLVQCRYSTQQLVSVADNTMAKICKLFTPKYHAQLLPTH
jgi:hypothetical protein